MKKVKIILAIIVVIALASVCTIAYRKSIQNNEMEKSAATVAECSIEMKENNMLLVKFNNQAGIKEIKYPSGDIITCNGKKSVGVDLPISRNGKYEYTLKDINNVEKKYTVCAPAVHVELTKNDINIDLESAKNVIKNNLVNSLVATNFVTINAVAGERETVDSQSTSMEEIFNSWNKIGGGTWKVNKDGYLVNSANQGEIAGYYSPNSNYTDIDISFYSHQAAVDDDSVGFMR